MVHFIDNSIKIFLVFFGMLTSATAVIALFPEFGIKYLLQLEFIPSYKIVVQHWSLLIFLTGVMLTISAYKIEWRMPVILFAVSEKLLMVILCVGNKRFLYIDGFMIAAIVDLFMASYFVLYVLEKIFAEKSQKGSPWAKR